MTVHKKEGCSKMRPSIANNTPSKGMYQRYEYIPLDGFKFELIDIDLTPFWNSDFIDFKHQTKEGGELNKMEHEYNGVTLRIYPSGYATLQGSFHKFHNSGIHNHNQFDSDAFKRALKDFCNYFKVTPQQLKIIQLEYGFNIVPPIASTEIIQGLIEHKRQTFDYITMGGKAEYKQAVHDRYILKIYNKGKQYGLDFEVLRIEHKVRNWTNYRRKGIVTFADFLKCNKRLLLDEIIKSINEVILFDNTIQGIDKYHRYSNPNYWKDLRNKSRQTFGKKRKHLNELSKEDGSNLIEELQSQIIERMNTLQGVTNSNKKRTCILTGADITSQRKDSFLLSHTGLYELLEKNLNEYKRIESIFLSDR